MARPGRLVEAETAEKPERSRASSRDATRARSVPKESERALDSLFGAYSYRRTGAHFAGICASACSGEVGPGSIARAEQSARTKAVVARRGLARLRQTTVHDVTTEDAACRRQRAGLQHLYSRS